MIYVFDGDIAKEYGVNEAIMITNLQFWIAKNKASEKHFYDGHWWTYNSKASFEKLFPFWSTQTIKTTLNHLKGKGVIITGNYNKNAYDKTLWYAFVDEEKWLTEPPIKKLPATNRLVNSNQPIPDINTDIIPDNIPPNNNNKLLLSSPQGVDSPQHFIFLWNQFVDMFAKEYPYKTPPAKIKSTTEIPDFAKRTKELHKLVKDLLSCDPDGTIAKELEDRDNDVWRWAFLQIVRKVIKSSFLRGEAPTTDKYPKPFRMTVAFLMRKDNFIRMVSPNIHAFED